MTNNLWLSVCGEPCLDVVRVVLDELDVVFDGLEGDLPIVFACSGLGAAGKEVLHFLEAKFGSESAKIKNLKKLYFR